MTTTTTSRSASTRTADLAYIAVFAALIIVLGFVAVPVGVAGVPILLQNTAVILAALVLGPRRGFYATALFLIIGLFLPVLAGGRTTIFALGSPTVGYLLSYLVAAPVAGLVATRAVGKPRGGKAAVFLLAGYLGLAIQYLGGTIGMMVRTQLDTAGALKAQLPFIPTDAIEMAVMVAIAVGVHSAFPQLLRGEATKGAR
ncbi:biotin transporter BioY [Corynebacterium sp. UBA2622]|uniref:biotin transporter BioY n=1 Tax=Corynebacterium sp. UBA2622 TaxID=1946393 RepID=UPI0025B7F921|nr:biotin transporter BioY [Corynebacterium sp. UBA2622]